MPVRLDTEGRIRSVLWKWLEPLPDGYLGRMEYVAGGYRLVPPVGVAPDLSAVYVFKDPR